MNHKFAASPGSALVAFGLTIALVGCGAPFSSATGGGGGGGEGGSASGSTVTSGSGPSVACGAGDSCGAGFVCFKPGCDDKGSSGVCKPVAATAEAEPVCGCDGVTYWSSRLAAASSQLIRAEAACTNLAMPKRCSGEGSACNQAKGEVCAFPQLVCSNVAPDMGTCWAMPPTCDGASTTARRCEGGNTGCENLCQMIKSGKAFRSEGGGGC
uniref:Lipoprotein n=1 Tax=Aetherobacter fasciculatus TaxID=888830 RepID=A0A3S7UUV6_9BACT|nr:hypothetical protein [Aetherobacter fasciculatus]